ncbi:MAG: hypothetical protein RL207_1039 [Bacteroidota bacterium]|jgi:hypothetical protein
MKILLLLLIVVCCPTLFAQKTSVQLQLTKGKTYTHVLNSQSEIFQRANGKTTKTNMLVKATITYKVKSVKKDSYYLETQYRNMNISIDQADGKNLNFNSDKPSDDILSNFFYHMCRTPFYITMNSLGEISSVEGIGRLVDNGIKGLDLPREKVEQIKASLTDAYGEKAFKGNFEIITLIYPKAAVELNESWETETAIYSKNIQATLKTNYHLEQSGEDYLQVKGESEIISNQQMEASKLVGSANIHMSLDKNSGWIHSAKVDQIIRIGNKEDENYSFTKMKTTYSDK